MNNHIRRIETVMGIIHPYCPDKPKLSPTISICENCFYLGFYRNIRGNYYKRCIFDQQYCTDNSCHLWLPKNAKCESCAHHKERTYQNGSFRRECDLGLERLPECKCWLYREAKCGTCQHYSDLPTQDGTLARGCTCGSDWGQR